MPVPVVFAGSTSPSPANVPPAIFTVAPAQVVLSGSDTVTPGDSVIDAAFSVKLALVATVSVGGSLTAVMLIVVVVTALRLLEPEPSLSSHVTVRVGSAPKLVGLS